MMLRQLGSSLGKKEIKLDLCLSHHTPKYISDGSNISILKKWDHKYKKSWHCIVGENFGSFVTHESKTFIFFEIANLSICLFKTARPENWILFNKNIYIF